MRTAAVHGFPVTVHLGRSWMRAHAQIIGGAELGRGVVLLCPDAAPDRHDRFCPPHR